MVRYFSKPRLIGIRQVWNAEEAPHIEGSHWSHWLASHKILSPGVADVFCHHLIKICMALNLAYPLVYELPTFSYQELLLDSCLSTVFLPTSPSRSLSIPVTVDWVSSLFYLFVFILASLPKLVQ